MNPIDQVKERLDGGRLWLKGELGDYDFLDRPVCLMGACYAVSTYKLLPTAIAAPLKEVIGEQYPDRTFDDDGEWHLPSFNDDPATTWADVERVLDKASVLWDEAHS